MNESSIISGYATEILTDASGMNYVAVYKTIPFYLNIWFAVAIGFFTLLLIALGIYYVRISLRNRTNVIIHMPDKTRIHKSYKNFTGTHFFIKGVERDKDDTPIKHTYLFKPDALEYGFFGRYIEYDYGISEPLNSKHRHEETTEKAHMFKLFSSLLNTQILVDLLLSSKFKELVKILLYIIIGALIINLILSGYLAYNTSNSVCTLANNNATINVIRSAMGTQ